MTAVGIGWCHAVLEITWQRTRPFLHRLTNQRNSRSRDLNFDLDRGHCCVQARCSGVPSALQFRMHQWLQAWTLWPAARESLSILLSNLISLSLLPCPSPIAQSPVDSFRLFPTDYIEYPVPYSNNQSNRQIPPRVNRRLPPDPHVAAQSPARGKGGPIPGKQPSNPDTGPAAGPRNRDQGPRRCCPARD